MKLTISPMMQQWFDCKEKAKDAILLFRLGDFYEAFYEDAKLLSKELDITLTARQDIPMSGIPHHTVEGYIEKLIAKGYLVAIAEQIEDPKQVKGIVKREIMRTVSPATIIGSSLVEEKSNNYFASISKCAKIWGLALLDVSTGELSVLEVEDLKELFDELGRRSPSEILISEKCQSALEEKLEELQVQSSFCKLVKESWHFDPKTSFDWLCSHFQTQSLDGFGMKGMSAAIGATGALLSYLQDELGTQISHIKKITPITLSSYLAIDRATGQHLELITPLHAKKGQTLLSLLDQTQTPMGGRLLKNWITHPLLSKLKIEQRLDAIEELIALPQVSIFLRKQLSPIRDLERLIMRIETAQASPRDLLALRISLKCIHPISEEMQKLHCSLYKAILSYLIDLRSLTESLEKAIVDSPPLRISDGNIFKKGYHEELDELLVLRENSKDYLLRYQQQLRESLGVKTLRVSFSKTFGYYIEVSRGQADKIPSSFERRQTLVNTERFISPELKEFEHKILTAEEKIKQLEYQLFSNLRKQIADEAPSIRKISTAIAHLDCLFALTVVSRRYEYARPSIDESDTLHIEEGKHPVIDQSHSDFIPNCTDLGKETRLMLITGPNMAGKSTYIRQVALIVIMAQMGCFVPAKSAHIGLIDQVFSRIGASDDLSRGQSTFMVEMTETANILNNATDKSLIILDEIGRGTSTYDGISIAWAVAEFLLSASGKRAKTLFATHYHELTELAENNTGAVNYNVAVKETDEGIVFLRKIVKGSTDKSYGIHVAKLAGIPKQVLETAMKKLQKLEEEMPKTNDQLFLFENVATTNYDQLAEDLKRVNLGELSPLKALQLLYDWQKQWS